MCAIVGTDTPISSSYGPVLKVGSLNLRGCVNISTERKKKPLSGHLNSTCQFLEQNDWKKFSKCM